MNFGPSDTELQVEFEGTKKCINNDQNNETLTEDLSKFISFRILELVFLRRY